MSTFARIDKLQALVDACLYNTLNAVTIIRGSKAVGLLDALFFHFRPRQLYKV
nr:hypothetical protein [Candidatus Sigynarchaeum springense]